MSLKNSTIGLGVFLTTLFAANKVTAQAMKSNIQAPFNYEIPTKLDKDLKIVTIREIDKEAPKGMSMDMNTEIIMMDNLVIVDSEERVHRLEFYPEFRRQINQAAAFAKTLPKGSILNFKVGGLIQQMDIGFYTTQKTDPNADFNGTPSDNLKKIHYDLREFKEQIKTNYYYKTKGKRYSEQEYLDIADKAENGKISFDTATYQLKQ